MLINVIIRETHFSGISKINALIRRRYSIMRLKPTTGLLIAHPHREVSDYAIWDLSRMTNIQLQHWNMILRRIFGPKRDENGEWRRLNNEELHSLYRSPNIVRVIKSRRLRWAGHIAKMEEGRSVFKTLNR